MVYVPADDAVASGARGGPGGGFLEQRDVGARIGDSPLEPGGQRPLAQSEGTSCQIDQVIDPERDRVEDGTQPDSLAAAADGGVELVAVQKQNPPAVSCQVHVLTADFDPADAHARELPRGLIVISRHVDDANSRARTINEGSEDILVRLRPADRAAERPEIDQVADDENVACVNFREERE
ncbi:MAG: hypothetical protein WD944_02210 [Steroidobacteraceae bacterium]